MMTNQMKGRRVHIEAGFAFSKDDLGEAVGAYVRTMGAIQAEMRLLSQVEGDMDWLDQLTFENQHAYLRLLDHLITNGIEATCNEILSGIADGEGFVRNEGERA